MYSDDHEGHGGKVARDNELKHHMSVDDITVMDRLDNENDESTRTQILTERKNGQISVYKDVLSVFEKNNGEENRLNRSIETFDDFVTVIDRRMERSKERANRTDKTTVLMRMIEEL